VNDNFISRARQLYEQNKSSPLFLRVADSYLSSEEIPKAISILENGLKYYPDHPLALILMGKALHIIGKDEEADKIIKQSGELLNSEQTYDYYMKSLNLPDKRFSLFDLSRGSFFVKSIDEENASESLPEESKNNPVSVDDKLGELAEEIMTAKIKRNNDITDTETKENNFTADKSKLASETLANIYLSQSQKSEAIKVYETLIERNPEKKEYYLVKISAIKSQ
jgi:tetratricopeptide (TPR) repeat protein